MAVREVLAVFGIEFDDAALKRGDASIDSTTRSLWNLSNSFDTIKNGLAGIQELFAPIIEGTRAIFEFNNQVRLMSNTLHMSVEDANVFSTMADRIGVSYDDMTSLLKDMQVRAVDAVTHNMTSYIEAYQHIGISVEQLRQVMDSPLETMRLAIAGIGRTARDSDIQFFLDEMGDAGTRLNPIMRMGSEGFERERLAIMRANPQLRASIDATNNFTLSMRRLWEEIRTRSGSLLVKILPSLGTFITSFAKGGLEVIDVIFQAVKFYIRNITTVFNFVLDIYTKITFFIPSLLLRIGFIGKAFDFVKRVIVATGRVIRAFFTMFFPWLESSDEAGRQLAETIALVATVISLALIPVIWNLITQMQTFAIVAWATWGWWLVWIPLIIALVVGVALAIQDIYSDNSLIRQWLQEWLGMQQAKDILDGIKLTLEGILGVISGEAWYRWFDEMKRLTGSDIWNAISRTFTGTSQADLRAQEQAVEAQALESQMRRRAELIGSGQIAPTASDLRAANETQINNQTSIVISSTSDPREIQRAIERTLDERDERTRRQIQENIEQGESFDVW